MKPWEKYQQGGQAKPWEKRQILPPVEAENPEFSKAKSAGLGFSQGASLGFGDEGAGLIAGATKDVFSGQLPTIESYQKARDRFRSQFKGANEANPKTYLASEIAGGASTALLPGGQAVTLPKIATFGAIQGLGNSEADLTQGDIGGAAKDTAIGGASALALGKALPIVGKGVKAVGKAVPFAVKKAISTLLGPSVEAINAYLKNPKAIKTASMEGIAENIPEVANKFNTIIKTANKKAGELLSTSRYIEPSPSDQGGAFTKDAVFEVIKSARRKLGGIYTDESKIASKTLERISENLKKIKNTISQKQVHGLISDLDDEIPWDKVVRAPETVTAAEQALINVRSGLDKALKAVNKEYADAIKPVEEAIQSRNEFLRKFSIKRVKGEGFVPSDTTYSRVKSSLNEGKVETDRILGDVKRITGIDILPEVQNAKYGQEFIGGRPNGFRNAGTMAMLGSGTGYGLGKAIGLPELGVPGAMVGASAGAYIDRKGGEMAAKLLDQYLSSKQAAGAIGSKLAASIPNVLKTNPKSLGKYAPLLKRAAALGTQQAALQHWLLLDSEPEYRKLVTQLESGD